MIIAAEITRILAHREPVDMRKSIDGLLIVVRQVLQEDPLSPCVFVFVNRKRSLLKAVYWDRTGFCLLVKRLERGRFVIPGAESTQTVSEQTFRLILDGIALGARAQMR